MKLQGGTSKGQRNVNVIHTNGDPRKRIALFKRTKGLINKAAQLAMKCE